MGRRETPRATTGSRGSVRFGVMCTREDAAGVDAGDGSAPAALAIEAVPCSPAGAVDLIDRRHQVPETWHFQPAEWVEFLAAVKGGRYDSAVT